MDSDGAPQDIIDIAEMALDRLENEYYNCLYASQNYRRMNVDEEDGWSSYSESEVVPMHEIEDSLLCSNDNNNDDREEGVVGRGNENDDDDNDTAPPLPATVTGPPELSFFQQQKEQQKKVQNTKVDIKQVQQSMNQIQLSNPKFVEKIEFNRLFHTVTMSMSSSRAATLAAAYRRLQNFEFFKIHNKKLVIHVLGCDEVECGFFDNNNNNNHSSSFSNQLLSIFQPFVEYISIIALNKIDEVELILIGPSTTPLNKIEFSSNNNNNKAPCLRASITCYQDYYHDYLERIIVNNNYDGRVDNEETDHNQDHNTTATTSHPSFTIAYNAGIWGYDSWKETIRKMMIINSTSADEPCTMKYIFIPTAYTLEEAEDDTHVVLNDYAQDLVSPSSPTSSHRFQYLWEEEVNPYHSKVSRRTLNAPKGRSYYENGAWQCWLLG